MGGTLCNHSCVSNSASRGVRPEQSVSLTFLHFFACWVTVKRVRNIKMSHLSLASRFLGDFIRGVPPFVKSAKNRLARDRKISFAWQVAHYSIYIDWYIACIYTYMDMSVSVCIYYAGNHHWTKVCEAINSRLDKILYYNQIPVGVSILRCVYASLANNVLMLPVSDR